MKKKILILETTYFAGEEKGGSSIQAKYYFGLLKEKGYKAEIFKGNIHQNNYQKYLEVISSIRAADFVIGFGTPLLDFYAQWLCFLFGKKGIFCLDTIIIPSVIVDDHIRRKIYPIRMFSYYLYDFIRKEILLRLPPPKMNLINIASCKYVRDKLSKSIFNPILESYLYPRIYLGDKKQKQKSDHKSVLFYGALYRGRGVIDLLKACRLLWEKNYRFTLKIYGWPVEFITKETIYREVRKEEKDLVIFNEKSEKIQKIVEDATVVVIPFRYPCSFQTPYTLLEPMALGVPVITTDVGSNCEWIKDGKTGFICRKEDIADIADKIETVFNNKSLVDKITENAYKFLEKRYQEKDILLTLLKKLEYER